jgi:hypothetical protein
MLSQLIMKLRPRLLKTHCGWGATMRKIGLSAKLSQCLARMKRSMRAIAGERRSGVDSRELARPELAGLLAFEVQ